MFITTQVNVLFYRMNQRETLLHLNRGGNLFAEFSTEKSSTDVSRKNIVSLKRSSSTADNSGEEPVLNLEETVNQYGNQGRTLFHLSTPLSEDSTTQNYRSTEAVQFLRNRSTAIFTHVLTEYLQVSYPLIFVSNHIISVLPICNNTCLRQITRGKETVIFRKI